MHAGVGKASFSERSAFADAVIKAKPSRAPTSRRFADAVVKAKPAGAGLRAPTDAEEEISQPVRDCRRPGLKATALIHKRRMRRVNRKGTRA
jgi:hypothetical protein